MRNAGVSVALAPAGTRMAEVAAQLRETVKVNLDKPK